jgi:DNA invertase Pin-like site-specific DNA recombinase
VEHNRKKNLEYQHAFRARHRSKEFAAYIERKKWQMDAAKSRFELLAGDGMSATAIGEKTGHSHHTVLRHLARPEARWRVGILRRLDMPEMEH